MHNIQYSSYPENCDKKKVEENWNNYVSREDWQEGSSGLLHPIRWLTDTICDDYDAAMKYISSHDRGWYDCLAIRYKDYPTQISDAAKKHAAELQAKVDRLLTQQKEFCEKTSVRNFKAEFVGCPSCGSKLKRVLLSSDRCPLCKNDMRAATTLERLTSFEKRIKEQKEKVADCVSEAQKKNKPTIKWLVKIEYHT